MTQEQCLQDQPKKRRRWVVVPSYRGVIHYREVDELRRRPMVPIGWRHATYHSGAARRPKPAKLAVNAELRITLAKYSGPSHVARDRPAARALAVPGSVGAGGCDAPGHPTLEFALPQTLKR